VGDFVFDYFVGSISEGVVVGFFAFDAFFAIKNALPLVDWLGFLYGRPAKMGI